jgi:CIC family chloride channel protein
MSTDDRSYPNQQPTVPLGGASGPHRHEDKVLLVLTLVIGAVVGLVVVAFIVLTENLGSKMYPAGGPAWRRVFVPVAGALSTGFLLSRYFPNARGSGIPQTKTALFLRDGFISFRTVLGKFGLCSVSLASGIALGREGPSVHVGAGIASSLGRRLGLSPASIKSLIPTGAAAALAAAFNTPISAVLFSLEEVMGNMHAPVLGSIVLGSATSWIVLHLILGDEPLFHVPAYQLVHPVEFVFYAVLGVLGGLVSVSFVKLLLWQRRWFLKAPRSSQWVLPAAGGLTVGLLGWFFPEVLGVGYAYVGKALNGQMLISSMALLVLLKVIATATCYSSGNAGGIFGPSLFIGAMMGGAVGGAAHLLVPDYTGSVGAYALVGMGTAFAGIVRVPLTSVIMVFEITRDYSIVVPLMISNLISYFISSRLQEEPIYEALQHQDGIRLPVGARAREELLTTAHAYRPEAQILSASQTVSQAIGAIDKSRGAWPVVDEHGLRGIVSWEQLESAVNSGLGASPLNRITLSDGSYPHVFPDDPLESAMRLLAGGRIKILPVVSRSNARELKGTISLEDVLAAYALGSTPATGGGGESSVKMPMKMLVGALAALVLLAGAAGFGNYFYRAERTKRAQRFYEAGQDLFQRERYPEAIEQFRSALSMSHSFSDRLALALALVKGDRMNEATVYLEEVLRERPSNGPANLAFAAVEAAAGRQENAILHYRRAIVGSWPDAPAQNRFHARIELIDYLEKLKRAREARAELLALAANPPGEPASQKQIGQMLLHFGLAREAVDLYSQMIKSGPPDAAEQTGLGKAYFAMGDYRPAKDAFRRALQIDPGEKDATRLAEVCDEILGLDPTLRGLASTERFRRSETLVRLILARMDACEPDRSQWPNSVVEAATAARTVLSHKRAPRSFAAAADRNILEATTLWAECLKLCGPPHPDDDIALILARVGPAIEPGGK